MVAECSGVPVVVCCCDPGGKRTTGFPAMAGKDGDMSASRLNSLAIDGLRLMATLGE